MYIHIYPSMYMYVVFYISTYYLSIYLFILTDCPYLSKVMFLSYLTTCFSYWICRLSFDIT